MANYKGNIGKGLTSSVLGDLKASGGNDMITDNYGRQIRWIRELSGDYTWTSSDVTDNYLTTLGNAVAAITETAQFWELDPSAALDTGGVGGTVAANTTTHYLIASAGLAVDGTDDGRWISVGSQVARIGRVVDATHAYLSVPFATVPTTGTAILYAFPTVVNGWLADGQFVSENVKVPGTGTDGIAMNKAFAFLPHNFAMKMLQTDEAPEADLDLQIAGADVDYARLDVSADAVNAAQRSYIDVPPGAVLSIQALNVAVDTNAITNFYVRDCNATDVSDYVTLGSSGAVSNTNTDILASTAAPWYIWGGKKGRKLLFYVDDNTAGTTDLTVTATIDFFAEWHMDWYDKAVDILNGRGRDFL